MDGFNLISIDKDNSKPSNPSLDFGIEIIDEEKETQQKASQGKYTSLYLFFSFVAFFGTILYFVFLIFYRVTLINEVVDYSSQLKGISSSIDVKEMQEFQTMDVALKNIGEKLDDHILTSDVMVYINKNLRKSLQVTDYGVEVKQDDVEVSFSAISPSIKEIAEQTERLFTLKDDNVIKSFSIVSLSFEGETKKLKFTMKITLNKSKVNAMVANIN